MVGNVHFFGLWDSVCTRGLIEHGTNELIAQVIHEEYLNEHRGEPKKDSLLPWGPLSEEFKDDNRAQADGISIKMRAINCQVETLTDWLEEPFEFSPFELDRLSRMEHERWWAYKRKKKKQHRSMVEWDRLDDADRFKDLSSVRNIPMILAGVYQKICKMDINDIIAQTIFFDDHNKQPPNRKAPFWFTLDAQEKTRYQNKAWLIESCVKAAGCGISGTGPIENKRFEFDSKERDAILRFHNNVDKEISEWPSILARGDLTIYRIEVEKGILESDHSLLKRAYGDEKYLEHPFPLETIRIGVTGHRNLRTEMIDDIRKRTRQAIARTDSIWSFAIRNGKVNRVILTPLAEGADRLVVKEALEIDASDSDHRTIIEAILPMPEEDYLLDFRSSDSKAEFEGYIGQAASVEVISHTESREEAYERAGRYVVDYCDVLIAIWNGDEAAGRGGTGETVRYARSLNRPILWINSETGELVEERID